MLDRLERAFAQRQASEDRLRRFLADASHELRTPLASIRGYAELHRMGATRAPADVERAMERIEGESARMGVLVEDLLTLARLDEVRDAARRGRPAPTRGGRGRRRSRRRSGPGDHRRRRRRPGRGGRRRRPVAAGAGGTWSATRAIHTPDGTPIEIEVTTGGSDVRLRVRDHGPGLPTGNGEELFERFWRAEGGRERGRAGAGLGLAIVAAIVEAHGGRVAASDAPGGGARFDVVLPAAAVRAPAELLSLS